MVNLKIHDSTTWFANNYNTHIAQYSQSKGNQTMEFGQLTEYNKKNSFLQKLCGKWSREISSRPLFIFWKSSKWGEIKWSAAYISIALNLTYNKSKQYKTLEYRSRVMSNFNFSEESGTSFFITFCTWFFKKSVSHLAFY